MMKNAPYLLVSGCLMFLLNGCNHYYYLPNNMAMPAIQKQHDAVISVAACDFKGTEFQAAYSPLKYTVLTFNHMNIPRSSRTDEEWGRGRLNEAGIGAYYGKFPWSVHLLGGYGGGFAENVYGYATGTTTPVRSRLDFGKWYIQPGFVVQTRAVRFGMAFRRVWLHYYKGVIDVDEAPVEELNAVRGIEQGTPFSLTEFGISFGLRIRPFTFTYNSTRILSGVNYYRSLHFAPRNYNFMVTFDLYELWRRKDTSSQQRKTKASPSN